MEDFDRAVRALARHFNVRTVVVIGSQALLPVAPASPLMLRQSIEIDAYPVGLHRALDSERAPASEEINALFGYLSQFHESFGFYIDGVDETTARLPPDWWTRRHIRIVQCDDLAVQAITPEVHDLAASKLARFDHKDTEFVSVMVKEGLADATVIAARLRSVPGLAGATLKQALDFLENLA